MQAGLMQRLHIALLCCAGLLGCASQSNRGNAGVPFGKIDHFIVIFQENWSFDGLYGKFPGANGIANAAAAATQVDKAGAPLASLAPPADEKTAVPDARFPAALANVPFDLNQYVRADEKTRDLVHRFYQEQHQIDGGKMDKFVAWGDSGALTMSYFDAQDLPEGKLAKQFTLADNFFHSAFGGSFLNHIWLACACMPVWPDAPTDLRAELDANGFLAKDGRVSPEGYVINTAWTQAKPLSPHVKDPKHYMPMQSAPTLGDRLSEKGVSWAWYAGGWDAAMAGNADKDFQYHHQPYTYFQNYADGTPAKAQHLRDEQDFLEALRQGTLPAVSFVKPLGPNNEHPGYADLARGQQHVADLVKAVQASKIWPRTAIIITYDENGGRWDHVAPPRKDRFGPGTRIPAIVVSPYAKRGYVDSSEYETMSILRTIEARWGLAPLTDRDAKANDLRNAFDFGS